MGQAERYRYDVAIAGGGFAGLTLALALARSDPAIEVALVGRPAAVPAAAGPAIALSATSRQLFHALGLWQALERDAQPMVGIDITDSALPAVIRRPLLHFDSTIRQGEPAAWMIENQPLYDALLRAAQGEDRIDAIVPETVDGFDTDGAGVTLHLGGGGTLAASLLAAADGRNSKLRKLAGIKVVGWSYPQVGIVATLAHERPHQGRAVQHFLPAGPFAILPLTGNRSSLVWTEEAARGKAIVALDDEAFLAELMTRFGNRLGTVSLAGPRGAHPLAMHIARAFVADRFVLIADAAHCVHPLAGQGLNIGLRDVAALTQVIVEARRIGLEPGAPQPLQRYERWRRFDSAFSGLAMDGLNRLFSRDSAPLRAIRSLGLGLVDRTPPLKRLFVHEAAGLTGELPRLLRGEAV